MTYCTIGERTTAAIGAEVIRDEWIERSDASRRRATEAAFRDKPRKAAALRAEAADFLERAQRAHRRAQVIRASTIEGATA